MSDLKLCPFCGASGKHVRRNDYHNTYRFVVCTGEVEHRGANGCYNASPGRNGNSGKCDHCWVNNIDCVFATEAWNKRYE